MLKKKIGLDWISRFTVGKLIVPHEHSFTGRHAIDGRDTVLDGSTRVDRVGRQFESVVNGIGVVVKVRHTIGIGAVDVRRLDGNKPIHTSKRRTIRKRFLFLGFFVCLVVFFFFFEKLFFSSLNDFFIKLPVLPSTSDR
jgi:hypothetical protein